GGAACPFSQGQTDSSGCAVAVNCAGSWGACNQATGTKTFNITQYPQNGGAACPSPTTQSCQKNCSQMLYYVSTYNNPMYLKCDLNNPNIIYFQATGRYTCFSWTGAARCADNASFSLGLGGSWNASNSHGAQRGTITALSNCSVTVTLGAGLRGQVTVNFCN
ncbi:MAG: hypothetical protein HUU56_17510, partial [Bdellovibrionaceae bacterium]|nr:hypothetical protein [Pseudobdellovibrionaceae bacterium]